MDSTTTPDADRRITLRPALYERLQALARRVGKDIDQVADEILTRTLSEQESREPTPHSGMSFAEILSPLQEDFEKSGLSEEDLDRIIEDARNAVWGEQQLHGR